MFHHQLCGFSCASTRRHQKRKHHRIAKFRTSILGIKKYDDFWRYGWLGRHISPDCFFKTSHSSDESLQLLVLLPEFLLLSYDCSQNISDILFHFRWMTIQHAFCIHRDTVDRCFSMASNRLGLGNVFVCCPPCEENLEPVRGSSLPNIDIHWHDLPWV